MYDLGGISPASHSHGACSAARPISTGVAASECRWPHKSAGAEVRQVFGVRLASFGSFCHALLFEPVANVDARTSPDTKHMLHIPRT